MKDTATDILDSRINQHDRYRFEIKMDANLLDDMKTEYKVETYFFIPQSLNFAASYYPRSQFYSDTVNHIRFKTPWMPIDKILNPTYEQSPLVKIQNLLTKLKTAPQDCDLEAMLIYELKLFGCVVKGSISERISFLLSELAKINRSYNEHNFVALPEYFSTFLSDIRNILTATQNLQDKINVPNISAKSKDAYKFLDEYVSFTIGDMCLLLLKEVRHNAQTHRELNEINKTLTELIASQRAYRKKKGYYTVIEPDSNNELAVMRKGIVNKFISSVLYLDSHVNQWEGATQLLFGVAAGIAMLVTLIIMARVQTKYAFDSLPFIFVAVTSYMLKDRIKDWLRIWFTKNWTYWNSDRQTKIYNPHSQESIGQFKEAFSFLNIDKVPPDVKEKRNMGNLSLVDEEGKSERVMKYEKAVMLQSNMLDETSQISRKITDITIYTLDTFINRADDAELEILFLNTKNNNALETAKTNRVYHMNLVIKYTYQNQKHQSVSKFARKRIVFNSDKILRLQEVIV